MIRIGGIYMGEIGCLKRKIKKAERHCSLYESLEESLKEVKQIREGKVIPKTWDELYNELKKNKEQ